MKKKQGTGSRLGTKTTVHKWEAHHIYNWRVSYVENGKHKRKGFKTRTQAEEWAAKRRDEALKHGTAEELTATERAVVVDFRASLDHLGVDFRSVVEAGIATIRKQQNSIGVEKAVRKFIQLKEAAAKSDRHLGTLRCILKRFAEDFGDGMISEVGIEDLDEWLLSLKSRTSGKRISQTTWSNYRRHVGMLFNQSIRWGYCDSNPVKETQRPEKADKEPFILTASQAEKLLSGASDEIRPALALGLFAGLRVSEIQRINWSEVDLKNDLIKLRGAVTKKKFRRVIPIRSNLKSLLRPYGSNEGAVSPRGYWWTKHYNEARRAAGFAVRERGERDAPEGMEWGSNAMRHSFASYGLQAEQDPAKITLELGHRGSPQTLYEHYRATCMPDEATEYWSLGLNRLEEDS